MIAFSNLVLQSCSFCYWGVCWKLIPWSRGSLGQLGAPWGRGGPCLCPLCPLCPLSLPSVPQETRLKEGIVKLKPHEEPLRSELLSGKFTILVGGESPGEFPQLGGLSQLCSTGKLRNLTPFPWQSVRDPSGASIALFTAKLHHPSKSVQHVVLQALFYLLDRAVER